MTKQFDLRFNFALHQKYDIASCAPSTKAKKTSCFTLSALDRIIILILPDSPLAWSNQQFTIENIAGLGQNNNLKVMLKHMLLALDRTNLNSFETLSRNCSTVSTMSTLHSDKEAPLRFSHVATLTS